MVTYEEVEVYITARKKATVPELQKTFSADYLTISKIVEKLVEDEKIEKKGPLEYVALAPFGERPVRGGHENIWDFSSIRERLKRTQREDPFKDDDDDEDEEEDEGDDVDRLERRRQEILELMREDSFTLESACHAFCMGLDVEEWDGAFFITFAAPEGETIRFKLCESGGNVYITDNGSTQGVLDGKYPAPTADLQLKVERIVEEYGIEFSDLELRLRIKRSADAFPCMLRLFAAMERLAAL